MSRKEKGGDGGGGGASGGGTANANDVFPDLHHKMSKKIAQLTKVIYHLNTKNEDHQLELETAASNYQLEVQQILRDAAARIGKFKDLVEASQAAANQEAQLEKLSKKHIAEKEAAMKEFQAFKSKMSDKERRVSEAFAAKYDSLKEEMDAMNGKFQEKTRAFESKSVEMKKALNEALGSVSSNMQGVKQNHEREMEDLVRSSNEKYQEMLVKQLRLREELKKSMMQQVEDARAEEVEKKRLQLEHDLGKLRAEMSGDKSEAMMGLRREMEEKLQAQRDEMMAKLEMALAEIRSKTDECARLSAEKEALSLELQRQLADMNQKFGDQLGGREQKLSALSMELSEKSRLVQELTAKVTEHEEEVARLQKLLSEKNERLVDMEDSLKSARQESAALKAEVAGAVEARTRSESELRALLAGMENDLNTARAELAAGAKALASSQEEKKEVEKRAQKDSLEAEEKYARLQSEKNRLQQLLDEQAKDKSAEGQKLAAEVSSLRQRLFEQKDEMLKATKEWEESSQHTAAALREKFERDLEAQKAALQALIDAASLREVELNARMESQRKQMSDRMDAMVVEHRAAIDELLLKHKEEKDVLSTTMALLENQLATLSEQADGEKSVLRNEVSKLEAKTKSLQRDLDAKKKEGERAESVATGLKNQIESLREELKASQKAFQDKMGLGLAQLEKDWQDKVNAMQDVHAQALIDLEAEIRSSLKKDLDDCVQRYEEEILVLKNALSAEARKASEEQLLAERERLRLEAELQQLRQSSAHAAEQESAKHDKELKALMDKHFTELEALRRDHSGSSERKEKALLDTHAAEILALKQGAEESSRQLLADKAAALEASERAAQELLRTSLAELEAKLNQLRMEQLAEQEKRNAEAVSALEARHEERLETAASEMAQVQAELLASTENAASLDALLKKERIEGKQRDAAAESAREYLLRDNEVALRKERERSERELMESTERANADMKLLKQEFAEDRVRFDERIFEVQKEYRLLEERYKNRESRPDDLARIARLEQEMVEKDELVARTRDEMMYFKREMLNREESYNVKFNAKPNVGIMQVLKTTTPGQDSLPPGAKSNKPTRAVQQQFGAGMSMGVGMSIGGGGGGGAPGQPSSASSSKR